MRRRILIGFVLILLTPLASAQTYTITDLGPLSPTAINTWAQVVGNLNGEAFIWTQFAGQKDLGTLTGGTSSYAASINDLGVVTGFADGPGTVISEFSSSPYYIPNQECSDLTQPFVWTLKNGMQGLGTVGFDRPYWYLWCEDYPFYGSGINDLGQVVGYTASVDTYQLDLLWTRANGMTLFGGSFPPTMANGVSNTGRIVGQNNPYTFNGIGHATSWTNGVPTDLGTLAGEPVGNDYYTSSSSAHGVNDLGQVVGWSNTQDHCGSYGLGCPIHAVLWTKTGGILDLGTLPGDTLSAASNINLLGQVIGSSGNALGSEGDAITVTGRPFIWSQRRGMQDLNTLIPANSGWVLNSATGINIWGQIVGSGALNGQPHGFLLTPKVLSQ